VVPADDATPRYETANREQVELYPCDLEALLPPGRAARLVWRFMEGLDLSAFYAQIKARDGRAGRPAIDPKILVALWLYATIDGVGSACALDRLLHRGIVTLARVAQDGTKVRASAGVGSFRRPATLRECLRQAEQQLTRTQRQGEAAPRSRAEAAPHRAAEERVARVQEALAECGRSRQSPDGE